MHLDLTINLGEIITWAMALGAFCYSFGRLNQRVTGIASDLDTLRDDHREHCDQDVQRFESLNQGLRLLASAPAKDK